MSKAVTYSHVEDSDGTLRLPYNRLLLTQKPNPNSNSARSDIVYNNYVLLGEKQRYSNTGIQLILPSF